MNVFQLREQVVGDYSTYVRSFLRINDEGIRSFVDSQLKSGRLWPDPLVQINPSYAKGGTVSELVPSGALHPDCQKIFRRRKDVDDPGAELTLHFHQRKALDLAKTGASYVLTTGTGSGKSLAYFVPIVDHVLLNPNPGKTTAIVVYPMNALCNSQLKELEKYLAWGHGEGQQRVTFARYTGQDKEDRRAEIAANPPDILLTNYVMLELLMTRTDTNDQKVIEHSGGLRFLVLDEMHTYRGRQGADVAMLMRRVRERLGSIDLQFVGTSATVAGAPTLEGRKEEVAKVASRLLGTSVQPDHVIGETLRSAITRQEPSETELRDAVLGDDIDAASMDYQTLIAHPLAAWVESAFGLQSDSQGRLERHDPVTIDGAATKLANITGAKPDRCRSQLRRMLLAGYHVENPDTGGKVFAFRLHQFVSRGDTVYSSLEVPAERHLALEGQQYVPGSRDKLLFPLAFCRECGQDYIVVNRKLDSFEARELEDRVSESEDSIQSGYLMLDPDSEWDVEPHEERIPEDWLELDRHGLPRVKYGKLYQFQKKAVTLTKEGSPAAAAQPADPELEDIRHNY